MRLVIILLLVLPALAHSVEFTSSNLPIIVIDSGSQPIPDEPKISASMGLIDNGPGQRNNLGDAFDGSQGPIAIELRGASTQNFPKKSYGLETRQADGTNRNVSLLGLPTENDWILYGPYSDKSLIRNALVYWLARQMGAWAPRSRFCELVLDGEYMGLYLLMEKIKRDDDRLDIARLNPDEVEGRDLSGGYILRIDRPAAADHGWYSAYGFRGNRLFYQYYYPDSDDIVAPQKAYIRTYIDSLETALAQSSGDYDRFLDLASFADYIIVNEISKNVDAYRLSQFMHKDRDDGKLTMGPVWDFNLALGNVNYNVNPSLELQRPSYHGLQIGNGATWFSVPFWFWWRRLFQDHDFIATLDQRWQTHRQESLQWARIDAHIDSLAQTLQEAQERNFERWPTLGEYVWPNDFIGQTHAEEIAYLKEWLQGRLAWLDEHFIDQARRVDDIDADELTLHRDTAVALGNYAQPTDFTLDAAFPNPFNGRATIHFWLPTAARIDLAVYNLAGQQIATLATGAHPDGTHVVTWNGRDDQGDAAASGLYLYKLQAGPTALSRKLILVR
ncbi:MAG: T9SS type A sorting domain-containing protein [Candidatus Latescibacteria bacterium]|nr:T9SS type A sorting domain-containing protein [Candidatus Latescibacterota bacterium]